MMVIGMSLGELSRYDTLLRVERGELRVEDASALLGLCRRQIFRLLSRLHAAGPEGLISGKRCRPSNRRYDDDFRERVHAAPAAINGVIFYIAQIVSFLISSNILL